MIQQQATAEWSGDLKSGEGTVRYGNVHTPYSFASRFQGGKGSSPDELLAAAHAGCFSMALSLVLGEHGHTPDSIRTTATVRLDPERLAIIGIVLRTEAAVPGMNQDEFQILAETAKEVCPMSKALAAVPIELRTASLLVGASARN